MAALTGAAAFQVADASPARALRATGKLCAESSEMMGDMTGELINGGGAASAVHLTAMAWSAASPQVPGPAPTGPVAQRLAARIAERLARQALRPLAVELVSWRRPEGVARAADNDFLSAMLVTAAPGVSPHSFRSWLQWQHPLWRWSDDPFPDGLTIWAGLLT